MKCQKNVCKVVVAGDGGVGKTTLVRRLIGRKDATSLTRGLEIESKPFNFNDGTITNIVFWDLGGQPQFRCFQESFFNGAKIILLVFDLNRYTSFHHLQQEWLPIIEKNRCSKLVIEILIGNKVDLGQTIEDELIQQFADQNNLKYLKVSAEKGTNFDHLVNLLLEVNHNLSNYNSTNSIKIVIN